MANEKNLDLIDRKSALEAICMYCCAGSQDDCPDGRCVDYRIISDLPKVNAVVHGCWVHSDYASHWKAKDKCGVCGFYEKDHRDLSHYHYCPNCGADMKTGGEQP